MDTKTGMLCELLECGFMDIYFLVELADKHEIEVDIEKVKLSYGSVDINYLIDYVIEQIADRFIDENEEEICKILEVQDLEKYRKENEMYKIFSDYLDSYLRFHNDEIQEIYEK